MNITELQQVQPYTLWDLYNLLVIWGCAMGQTTASVLDSMLSSPKIKVR